MRYISKRDDWENLELRLKRAIRLRDIPDGSHWVPVLYPGLINSAKVDRYGCACGISLEESSPKQRKAWIIQEIMLELGVWWDYPYYTFENDDVSKMIFGDSKKREELKEWFKNDEDLRFL